jgi:cation transport regulator ChaC
MANSVLADSIMTALLEACIYRRDYTIRMTVRYFAYGSNMSSARLRKRVPNCVVVCVATLEKHALRFHKRSRDGSGKCNAFYTGLETDRVIGVLFEIPENEKSLLDSHEGLGNGYDEKAVALISTNGMSLRAVTYVASTEAIDDKLQPFDWYRAFVIEGAKEHGLPQDYIDTHITL